MQCDVYYMKPSRLSLFKKSFNDKLFYYITLVHVHAVLNCWWVKL